MPIYEFTCNKCDYAFEVLVSLGGEKKVTCSRCGSKDIQKLLSAFGIGGAGSRTRSTSSSCATCSATSCETCR